MKTRGRILVVVVLVVALLAGGGYAAAYFSAGDALPRDARIAGVDVGGLTPAEAEDALREGLTTRLADSIEVSVAGGEGGGTTVDRADLGLEVDYAASVDAAARDSSRTPAGLWRHYTGGADTDAVVRIDTPGEANYYRNGGIMQYVLRSLRAKSS